MRLSEILHLIIESDASEQAKELGLTSAGWGRWRDKTGKVVAKTVNGKLVKLSAGDAPTQSQQKSATPEPTQEPPVALGGPGSGRKRKPIDLSGPTPDKTAGDWKRRDAAIKAQTALMAMGTHKGGRITYSDIYHDLAKDNPNPHRNTDPRAANIYDATLRQAATNAYHRYYRNPKKHTKGRAEWAKLHRTFITAMDNIESKEDLADTILLMMGTDPEVHVNYNDSECDKVSELINATPAGFYSQHWKKVAISKLSTRGAELFSRMSSKDFESMKRRFNTKGYRGLTADESEAIHGFHTLVHEIIHANDLYLEERLKAHTADKDTAYYKRHAAVLEALTEMKAQEITEALVFGYKGHTAAPQFLGPTGTFAERGTGIFTYIGAYHRYVSSLQTLEARVPGTANALWEETDSAKRVEKVNEAIETMVSPLLAMVEDREDGLAEGVVDDFLNWVGDTQNSHDKLFATGMLEVIATALRKCATAKRWHGHDTLRGKFNSILNEPDWFRASMNASSSLW